MQIDDKLKEIRFSRLLKTPEVHLEVFCQLDDEAIAQIKQAFADEQRRQGYLAPRDNEGNFEVVMTGQMFYDRFEKIVREDTDHFEVDPMLTKEDLPTAITNKVLEAAKKAAGIE